MRAFFRLTEAEALPALLDPARTEPLTLVPSDLLLTYAQHQKKNFVALVSESLADTIRYYLDGQSSLSLYMRTLLSTYEERETEKSVSLRPKWSSYQWSPRVDRSALSRLMHQILKDKHARLRHLLEFDAIAQKHQHSVADAWIQLLDEETAAMGSQVPAFLLSLTPAQRQALLEGESLVLNQLPRPLRDQLLSELYSVYDSVFVRTRQESDEDPLSDASSFLHGWLHYFLPNGVPDDAQISLPATTKLGVFTQRRAGVWTSFHDALRLATAEHFAKNESLSQLFGDSSRQKYEQLRSTLMPLIS